ncbi:hypothetical protein [Rubrivirga litoralis]|uniref:Type IV secretion system protein VirB4 n=1 Tax=Rubrivirga litoralis TaxID=3075598 RepID=A0ABU3BUI9_9BACT|nr:hypothetical protein [Rubrivirga sp. F394]MDT0632950.1 hypothetical protein [Rubrivirga sp. F394]
MSLLALSAGLTAGALAMKGLDALREHRREPAALADLLGWGFLVDDGVVLLKDGSFLCGWEYRGLDQISSTPREVDQMTDHVAAALGSLGDGWMVHVDAVRRPAVGYAPRERCHFPDPVTAYIDEVRRASYTSETDHYDTTCTLHLTYTPPAAFMNAVGRAVVKGRGEDGIDWDRLLGQFAHDARAFQDRVSSFVRVRRLGSARLLRGLHESLTGLSHGVGVPPTGAYLDYALSDQPFVGGFEPQIGDQNLRLVSVQGYPDATFSGHGGSLTALPFPYRFSTRFIPLSPSTAEDRIKRMQLGWFQKRKGAADWVQSMSKSAQGQVHTPDPAQTAFQDANAVSMLTDAAEARRVNSSGHLRFGYATSTVVVSSADAREADDRARAVLKKLRDAGFSARVEDLNAVDAFLGTLPGHGSANLRRPMLSTGNVADTMPLTAPWGGPVEVPSQFFPPGSPPLLWATAASEKGKEPGTTPFRLCLHEGDVGHTLIVGATGAGKSVLVGALVAQWRRYGNAQTYVFDVGYSHYLSGTASGARHYDLAGPDGDPVELQPLRDVDRPDVRAWAVDWLETLFELQGVRISPTDRQRVTHAVGLLADNEPVDRTMTALMVNLGDERLRDLVRPYTIEGAYGQLLDAQSDGVLDGQHQVFELSNIISMSERVLVPVLTHLFRRVEEQLTGAPTLIVIEEAWAALMKSLFAQRLRQWLLTLRKRNAAVVIVAHTVTQIREVENSSLIIESCPSRIFLPNSSAADPVNAAVYRQLGLNEAEIGVVAKGVRKQQYYFRSPSGARQFELALSPPELAFLGAPSGLSSDETKRAVREMAAEHGPAWPVEWLRRVGLDADADRLATLFSEPAPPPPGDGLPARLTSHVPPAL